MGTAVVGAVLLASVGATAADAGEPPSTRIEAKISKHIDGPFKERARVNIPPVKPGTPTSR